MENMEPPLEEIILRHDDDNKDSHNKNDRNKDDRNIDDHNKEDRNIYDQNKEDRNIDDHNKEDDHKDCENKDPTTPKKKRKSIFRRASNAIRKRFSKWAFPRILVINCTRHSQMQLYRTLQCLVLPNL